MASGWTLAEILPDPSHNNNNTSGWGTSAVVQDDTDKIGQCVEYFSSLRPQGKIVLMGRSTGCHDIIAYHLARRRRRRRRKPETTAGERPHVHGAVFHLPLPDLAREQLGRSFGRLPPETPLCILYSGNEQQVPGFVDKERLVWRYLSLAEKGGATVHRTNSGMVLGTGHRLGGKHDDDDGVLDDTLRRVVRFLAELK